jgi:hypothetical protein
MEVIACRCLIEHAESLTYRDILALLANRAGQASRVTGAPILSAASSVDEMVAWFAWNDPNGLWFDCGADAYREEEAVERCEECVACRPLTVDDAWEVLGEMLRDEYREYREAHA